MGNFSRDTFNKLKHYVGVRLQQGVPIVDADWNELEDIRKYELQSFLKWFVGNGVPKGNDGFRILPVRTVSLTSKNTSGPSTIAVDRNVSTAADALGFGPGNASSSGTASSPAQLTGAMSEPFVLADGMTITIKADGVPETALFKTDDFLDISNATAAEVVNVVNRTVTTLTASVGAGNDFIIKGGDGTPEGAGRCLVEGWDVINESNLKYSAQSLYNNDGLAAAWGVDKVDVLNPPPSGSNRTDLVYLDVWEREVDHGEDDELVNKAIGIETCVRRKREWVVRVKEGVAPGTTTLTTAPPEGHVYYPLARLRRRAGDSAIRQEDIIDLRRRELQISSQLDIQQIIQDAFGGAYALDHDGQPNLKLSLREVVNTLLRGAVPGTLPEPLIAAAPGNVLGSALADRNNDIWVFWSSSRSGTRHVYYNRNGYINGSWDGDQQLSGALSGGGDKPRAVIDQDGIIWVFWVKGQEIWCRRQSQAGGAWGAETKISTGFGLNPLLCAVAHPGTGDIWLFGRPYEFDSNTNKAKPSRIYYVRYNHQSSGWVNDFTALSAQPGINYGPEDYPTAAIHPNGDIWLFWVSVASGTGLADIWYKRHVFASGNWDADMNLSLGASAVKADPHAFIEPNGNIWLFWRSDRSGGNIQIWYNRRLTASGQGMAQWEGETQLTTDEYRADYRPYALRDKNGEIWLFWDSQTTGADYIWYSRYSEVNGWAGDKQLTTNPNREDSPVAIVDPTGDIWVFWNLVDRNNVANIWYRKLIPAI